MINDESPDEIRYPSIPTLLVIWALFGGVAALSFPPLRIRVATGDFSLLAAWMTCYIPWAFISPVVFRLEKRFPLGPDRRHLHMPAWVLGSIAVSLFAAFLMLALFVAMLDLTGNATPDDFDWHHHWLNHWPPAMGLFWATVAVGYFIRSTAELERQKRSAVQLQLEKSRLEASLNAAQLDMLRARLNPHFLFNSLQNISVMIRQNPVLASSMVTKLGDLLRVVLRGDSQTVRPLEEEVHNTRLYTEIEQMRFGDRLEINFALAAESRRALVPCFVLQPLVENAIMHGLKNAEGVGVVTVSARVEATDLVLCVGDNGTGAAAKLSELKLGIGLGATRERLERMFPNREPLEVQAPDSGGFEVRICIPARFDAVDTRELIDATADR